MGLLKEYLKEIYGKEITNRLIMDKGNREKLKSKKDITTILQKYTEREKLKCFCSNPQHQDFPGWIGYIRYKNGKITNKNILIFGLEISSEEKIRKDFEKYYNIKWSALHIAYDFGYERTFRILSTRPLWRELKILLPLRSILRKIYVTDVAKCFTKDLTISRNTCFKQFFIDELNLFQERNLIFIFQGRKIKSFFKNYFDFIPNKTFFDYLESKEEILKECGIKKTKNGDYLFELGKFNSNEKKIKKSGKYLQIPHSSQINRWRWKRTKENIENEKLKDLPFKIKNFLFK